MPLESTAVRVRVVGKDDPEYPENLRPLEGAPGTLFVRGDLQPGDRVSVAIVGTRSPTSQGKLTAVEMARDLAGAGMTVVSGLAMGIDAAAHEGALEAGGRTIACLATGVDVPYPRCNASLFDRIPHQGALVSEYEPGTGAKPFRFPMRNRIISGMSLGVVVVEAGEKSGALITAGWALKQGRPVMAVPGSPKSGASAGANRLIQDGAYLVTSAQDVLSFLGREGEYVPQLTAKAFPTGQALTLEEGAVLQEVRRDRQTADQIVERLPAYGAAKVVSLLSALEVKGIVCKGAGGKYLAKT